MWESGHVFYWYSSCIINNTTCTLVVWFSPKEQIFKVYIHTKFKHVNNFVGAIFSYNTRKFSLLLMHRVRVTFDILCVKCIKQFHDLSTNQFYVLMSVLRVATRCMLAPFSTMCFMTEIVRCMFCINTERFKCISWELQLLLLWFFASPVSLPCGIQFIRKRHRSPFHTRTVWKGFIILFKLRWPHSHITNL